MTYFSDLRNPMKLPEDQAEEAERLAVMVCGLTLAATLRAAQETREDEACAV